MLQISFVQFLSNGKAKMKLAILAFLYCGEFVKNPSDALWEQRPICIQKENVKNNLFEEV